MNRRLLSDDELKVLVTELSALRGRGLPHIDIDTKAKARKELPLLEALAFKHSDDNAALTRVGAIELLLRDAIELIEDGSYKEAALTLFLLDESDIDPKSARELVAERRGRKFDDERTRFHHEQQIRSVLAVRINDLMSSSTQPTRQPAAPASDLFYVRRHELHERFRQLQSAGTKLILLVGQPGMGKSQLARAVVTENATDPAKVALIRTQGNDISKSDLYTALAAANMDTDGVEFGDPAFHLARLVNDEQAPEFVLIDGLDDAAILSELLPPLTRSIVFATARSMTVHVGDVSVIKVGPMSANESVELVQLHLPNVTEDDAEILTQKLHGFPLVIRYACQLLANSTLSVDQLSQALESSPPTFLAKVPSGVNSTLVAVLGRIVETITAIDPMAFYLLECMAFLQSFSKISQQFLVRYMLVGDESTPEAEAETALIYAQAVRRLQDFSLIEVIDADYLSMHRLTVQALRILLSDRIAHVTHCAHTRICRAYRDRYSQELNALDDPDDFLAHDRLIYHKTHLRDIFSAFLASSEKDRLRFVGSRKEAHQLADLYGDISTLFCRISDQAHKTHFVLSEASKRNLGGPGFDELREVWEGIREKYPLATVPESIPYLLDLNALVTDENYLAALFDGVSRTLRRYT